MTLATLPNSFCSGITPCYIYDALIFTFWGKTSSQRENSLPAQTRKTRIIDVVYNASNNELVRTKTLVKNAIVQVDATPFRQWYEAHYATPLGRKKSVKLVRFVLFPVFLLQEKQWQNTALCSWAKFEFCRSLVENSLWFSAFTIAMCPQVSSKMMIYIIYTIFRLTCLCWIKIADAAENKFFEVATNPCECQKRKRKLKSVKLQTEAEEAVLNKKRSKSTQKKYEERKKTAKVETALEEQFSSGRVLGNCSIVMYRIVILNWWKARFKKKKINLWDEETYFSMTAAVPWHNKVYSRPFRWFCVIQRGTPLDVPLLRSTNSLFNRHIREHGICSLVSRGIWVQW